MAVLTDQERAALAAAFNSDMSRLRRVLSGVTKADIRASLNAMDDWWEANRAAMNTAIPQPARANLTTKQKVYLFLLVIMKREEVEP